MRNIGTIEGNSPASDNSWEEVKKGGEPAIKQWIAAQMKSRSCTIVLVGAKTANRQWINHEIIESWNDGMGVVGIYIHGLLDRDGYRSAQGANPFDYISYGNQKLSSVVKCYNPAGRNSKEEYKWISKHLANAVEEAIRIRTST